MHKLKTIIENILKKNLNDDASLWESDLPVIAREIVSALSLEPSREQLARILAEESGGTYLYNLLPADAIIKAAKEGRIKEELFCGFQEKKKTEEIKAELKITLTANGEVVAELEDPDVWGAALLVAIKKEGGQA